MNTTLILAISVALQFVAAFLALRLIPITGKRLAWLLIALAVFLMGVRRSITLFRLLTNDLSRPPDLSAELVALVISFLMVAGIAWIAPLFTSIKRSEDVLKTSEANFRELFENVFDGVYRTTPQGKILMANPALVEMLGYDSEEELRSVNAHDLYADPEERKRLMNNLEKRGGYRVVELCLKRKDGSELITLDNSRTVCDDQGKVLFYEGTLTDITKRKQAEKSLQESQARLQLILKQIPAVVWTVDTDLRFTSSAGSGLVALNLQTDQVVGKSLFEYFQTDDAEFSPIAAHRRALQNASVTYEVEWLGHVYEAHVEPMYDDEHHIIGCIGMALDITERKQFEKQLIHLANHDPLTSLFNRRRLEEELKQHVKEAHRYKTQGALLWMDLDRFKEINDTLGHRAGDELLVGFAELLYSRLRESDVLARLGGDEFAILLPHTSIEEAQLTATRLLSEIGHYSIVIDDQPIRVTASMGIVSFPNEHSTVAELLAQADMAMYRAKEKGLNKYCVYMPDSNWKAQLESRISWSRRISDALEHGKFLLHAQPILNLKTNQILRYELLLRMEGDDNNVLFPGAFLTVAERFGLIHEIDRWVVRQAIQLLLHQQQQGNKLHLEVNLSGKDLVDDELLTIIQTELDEAKIDPQYLILEITETAAVADLNKAKWFIETLQNLKCQFALDDFGIGFSSFQHLKRLPVNYLKIDGSFIQDLPYNPVDQHLVQAMVQVAKSLGKKTIAEFVQNEETLELLRKYGVDYAQGFYIGQPQPLEMIL